MQTELSKLVSQLRSVQYFKNLADLDLQTIVSTGYVMRYPAGKQVFVESEPCSGLCVLLSGQVRLVKQGPQGQVTIMAVIEPVIMFNEVPALDGGANAVTAVAVQDSLVWVVSFERFQTLLGRYPQVAQGLLRVLAARNRLLIAHYEDLSFRPVHARLARLLLELSQAGQVAINRREHSNRVLAARVATAPEAISRALKALQREGSISADRQWLTVISTENLGRLAQIPPDLFGA
jgi:CRP-like cAMP-binding protein